MQNIKEKVHQYFGVGKDQSLASLDGESKLMLKSRAITYNHIIIICTYDVTGSDACT